MGGRTQIAKVGAGVWIFTAVAAIIACVLPQALVEHLPALMVAAVTPFTLFLG